MVKIKKEGIILKPTKLAFENLSVYNPGVWQEGPYVHILYRAQNERFISSFGYAKLKGPLEIVERWKKPLAVPTAKYEKKGIEDPRIIKIKDTVYVVYVAHDGRHAVLAYLSGPDLFNLKRGGIISPRLTYKRASRLFNYSKLKDDYYFFASFYEKYAHPSVLVWEKDGVLFPEKIKGKFALLHRVLPDIHLAYGRDLSEFKDNNYWRDHIQHLSRHVVLEGRYGFEARHIGAGAPPVRTKKGWLLIYHGVEPRNKGRIYYAGAALLDLKNPQKVIARLPYPLFAPSEEWEHLGHVHDVVFPTGTAVFGTRLYIYYGAADTYVAAASVHLPSLLKELLKHNTGE
jgi:predicted GH43/DUF377 family glycosyl hydrolase